MRQPATWRMSEFEVLEDVARGAWVAHSVRLMHIVMMTRKLRTVRNVAGEAQACSRNRMTTPMAPPRSRP